jgi:hypothetical protein
MAGLLDGSFNVPQLPGTALEGGLDLGSAMVLPPGGNVFYVRGTGGTVTNYSYDPAGLTMRLNATVEAALTQCVSGRGDVVVALPGHTENLTSTDAWSVVAGVRIMGLGGITNRPVFTFTAATSQVDIDVENVRIEGCKFLCAGPAGTTALSVAAPFNVTAAGFQFVGNECQVGIDADQLCTNMMLLAAGADDTLIANNYIYGALAAEITTIVTTAGAVDRLKIIGNIMSAAVATAATGVLLDLDNAAIIECYILGNRLQNKTASSKYVIDGHASSTGIIDGNRFFTADGGTAPAVSGWVGCDAMTFGVNECSTAPAVSALLSPAVDA